MRTIQKSILCLILHALISSAAVAADEAPSIAPEALQSRVAAGTAPVILDVRSAAEFDVGHIPGAINIPHTALAGRLSELPAEAEIAVYCMMGPRARLGEQTLLEEGRKQVFHVEGGLAAWQKAGLPVSTGPSER